MCLVLRENDCEDWILTEHPGNVVNYAGRLVEISLVQDEEVTFIE